MSTQPSNHPASQPANAAVARPSPPRGPALVLGLLGILGCFASSSILVLAAFKASPTSWTLIAIQALPLLAIVVTIATIRGSNAASPSMAILCASGAVLAAAGLSHLSSGTIVIFNQPMRTWTALSAAAASAFLFSSALNALWHHRDAFRRAQRGLCWALPFLAIILVFLSPLGPSVTAWLDSQGSIIRLSTYTLAAVMATISLCAATELLVTAFQRVGIQTKS